MNTAFVVLREDKDLTDVTLSCGDGQQVEAHKVIIYLYLFFKVILAASSPFFQNLLKRTKHPHPPIYMKGVEFENPLAIVDFQKFCSIPPKTVFLAQKQPNLAKY